jgi:DNA gyrase subunit A
MLAIQASERNGNLVGAILVEDTDEVMLISTGGVLIRTKVDQIREQGRTTQGVTLIALGEGEKLAGLERVVERDEDDSNGKSGEGDPDGEAGAAPVQE